MTLPSSAHTARVGSKPKEPQAPLARSTHCTWHSKVVNYISANYKRLNVNIDKGTLAVSWQVARACLHSLMLCCFARLHTDYI